MWSTAQGCGKEQPHSSWPSLRVHHPLIPEGTQGPQLCLPAQTPSCLGFCIQDSPRGSWWLPLALDNGSLPHLTMSTPATGAEQGISGTIQAISQPRRASCPAAPDGTCRSCRVLGTSVCLNTSCALDLLNKPAAGGVFYSVPTEDRSTFDSLIHWMRENESSFSLLNFY